MNLKDYFFETGVSVAQFSKDTGVGIKTLYDHLSGKRKKMHRRCAIPIVKFTKGKVSMEDLGL